LLSALGPEGNNRVQRLLKEGDARLRVAAFRALRRGLEGAATSATSDAAALAALATRMAADPSAAVRREVALALRDLSWVQARDALIRLARGYDGQDRWYLEALGTGAHGKESELYHALAPSLGQANPLAWNARWTSLNWRLHRPESASAFRQRALAGALPEQERRRALTALAYIGTSEAVQGILEAATQATGSIKADALWWLLNRKDNVWKDYALDVELKRRGIYDPEAVALQASSMPDAVQPITPRAAQTRAAPSVAEVLALRGNARRGHQTINRCTMCHRIGAEGQDVGPDLSSFAHLQTREVLVQSILEPSADIAPGFDASEILTTDGVHIEGLIVSEGNPVIIVSAGGLTQLVPPARIKTKKNLGRSLMWTPEALGLTAQDVADVAEFLRSR
jgi:putative heme-binding domain-containing protein